MTKQRNNLSGTTDNRITRVEAGLENLGKQVTSLDTRFQEMEDRIGREFTRLRESFITELRSSKIPMTVWVSFATLVVMIVIGAGSAAYVPVWITTNNINAKAQHAVDLAEYHSTVLSDHAAKFVEVETQFKKSQDIHNMHFAEQQRANNIITQIAQGVKPIRWPEAPYYFPSNAKNDGTEAQSK